MFHPLKSSRGLRCLGLLAGLALAGSVHAADIHVPGQFPTITIALNNASNGDSIIIAPGTYFETLDLGSKQVSLIGTGGADVTTIDAFALGSCLRITGGQMLDTVVEGLTFQGGLAYRGAGIFIDGASATIRNCRFTDNEAVLFSGDDPGDGGGLFIEGGTLVLENCDFLNNLAGDAGGGAYFRSGTTVTMTNSLVEGNIARQGAGLAMFDSNVEILDSSILMNGTTTDTERGGGLQAHDSNVFVDRCRFDGNAIYDDGFAVMARSGAQVELRNSLFLNNMGAKGADPHGTIYSSNSGTHIDVFHCTLVENSGPGNAGLRTFDGGELIFRNGIIWDNDGTSVVAPSPAGSITATHSVIQDGFAGTGNLSINPMLDAQFAPMPGSPAIDAADTNVLIGEDPRDFAMNPRAVNDPDTAITGIPVYGMTADMGAFEFQPEGGPEPDPTCLADIVSSDTFQPPPDGLVDGADLAYLLGAWGACN